MAFERGQAAVAVVGAMVVLVLASVCAGVFLRASLVREDAAGTADGAALAAAAVLRDRADDLLPRFDQLTGRTLPPRLTRAGLEALAHSAGNRAAQVGGAQLVALRIEDGAHGQPLYADATVRVSAGTLPSWLGSATRASLQLARARAGLDYPLPETEPGRFRAVDLNGVGGATAVIAAASAQLGWPYLWGGESRAEGGFDCSGLIDYALAAAGFPVGRPTAAGLQGLTVALPLGAARAGDLVFVGDPAHHVGLIVAPGLAIEAPHRGAVVHYEPLAEGGWTSAGRLAVLAAAPAPGALVPDWVPAPFREGLAAASRAEDLPVAFLAAQIEAESGFDPAAVSPAGALGLAQFMPGTWTGSWNPWREASPLDPAAAIHAQARYMRALVDRSRGDLARALAAYHDGWDGSAAAIWPPLTRAYVSAILRRFGGSSLSAVPADLASMRGSVPGAPVLRLVAPDPVTPNG